MGALVRVTGSIDLAEELAQDALVDALRQWPREGTPANPGAWLTAVARRKAIDRFRRDRTRAGKYAQIGRSLQLRGTAGPEDGAPTREMIEDDRLRLIFVACHPVLAVAARAALTLRLVGGLTTAEIARAYVVPEPTVAQRIVRAKKAIARAGVPFEVPKGEDRAARLGSVLEVIYVIFNEGYSATSGESWLRPELCGEALRLGRALAGLAPEEPEAHGLVALMEFQSSRLSARVGPWGEPVLLADQDRRRWDPLHIVRGEVALRAGHGAVEDAGSVRASGRHCCLPSARLSPRRDRLGRTRAMLRGAFRCDAVADRRTQPRRRPLDGRRGGGRAPTRG